MLKEHKTIQEWIKDTYNSHYIVKAEIDKQNVLPSKEYRVYQPDVVIYNRKGDIEYIIEIENDPVRKALIGAAVLADHSIFLLKQKKKPKLLFVVYSINGIRQMHNFKEKLVIARRYCSNLKDIEIVTEEEFRILQL